MTFALPPLLAVIEINFDPLLRIGELTLRWQTIGVTLAVLAALAIASRLSFRRGLGLPDLATIVAGVVPGAVIGGRLVHGLVFWDAYAANPMELLDPSVGTLSLTGAVLGGALTGAYICRLIGAPVRRWADVAAAAMLLAIGIGKLAQFLGGSGQGLPFDGPWAVAFTGAGPWISSNPAIPAHPSQIYEGLWNLLGILVVSRPSRPGRLFAWTHRPDGEGWLFVGALGWFLVGRVIVGFTWRDQPLIGPLNGEQAIALMALAAIVVSVTLWVPRYRGREQRVEEYTP